MSEAQRFLRYVTPGLVFLAEALFLLVILLPGWTVDQLERVKGDQALGVVFATLLASGGVGFIFSALHHEAHWTPINRFGRARLGEIPAIDHSGLIARLRAANIIELVNAETDTPIAAEVTVSRPDAWVVATSMWHERLTTSEQIRGAEPRAGTLIDMTHTTGTARVASAVAWLAALAVAASVVGADVADFSLKLGPVLCFIFANVIGALLFVMHRRNYRRVSYLAQGVIEEVLHDALLAELHRPVRTRVLLTRQNAPPR